MIAKLVTHNKWTVSVLQEGDRCRVERFIERLNAQARNRFGVLFERTANEGPIHNETQFKYIKEWDLYEFKALQYRVLAFQIVDDRHVILTNGFKEQQKMIPKGNSDAPIGCGTNT